MKKTILIFILIFASLGASKAQQNNSIATLAEEYWQHQLEENPGYRIKYGLPVEKLPDPSYAHAKEDAAYAKSLSDRLQRVDASSLNHEDRISYDIMKWQTEHDVQGLNYFWFYSPITPYASPIPVVHRIYTEYKFASGVDLNHYLDLLKQYPGFVRSLTARVKEQANNGILLPREELAQVKAFLLSFQQEPESSIFYVKPDRLSFAKQAEVQNFQKRIADVIQSQINPSLKELTDFLSADYSSKAPEAVGLAQYPKGKEAYKYLVTYHTTMPLTPEDVHQFGLKEVDRINGEMTKIRQSLNFKGTKAEFHKFLKTDPRFFPKTADEVGEKLMSYVHRIEPEISKYFLHLPRAPYGVHRLNPALEGAMTFGYYQDPTSTERTGYYYYNGSNLSERSLLMAAALIYHELIPGHHFQINLQGENTSLPKFRREPNETAYVEGWGEYASALAGEMGMYRDPYDQYGRLAMEMFLSCRLVVDSGMNYFGWSRQRAAEFMKENTLNSDREIFTETLRYSTDIQGQALAYKMGSSKIFALRAKEKEKLKDQFDIRKFHDAVLGSGAMPMAVLEQHLEKM